MKIRLVLVALVLAAVAACDSSPTAPEARRPSASVPAPAFDTETPSDSSAYRGGWGGNGN